MQLLTHIDVKCHQKNKPDDIFLYVFFQYYEEIHPNIEAANEEHFRAANSV